MLAVVAFLALTEEDGRGIEAIRREHDPNATRIAAHFTLVFPTGEIRRRKLTALVDAAAGATAPLAVSLKRILVHQEGADAYVYLVPEQGYDALVALHARLNPGAGGSTFTPHVTIARLGDRKSARGLATALAAQHVAANGRIEALAIVEVPAAGPVRTLHEAPLRG
jgi:2'-5' RNA ligase